jgi:RNA polymerase sigma-70 factor (ECF subfamily)
MIAQRMLFDAVLALVWKALDRHRFSEADRKDLAQDVAIAAFRRHPSYRADRGSPGQWLSGIVRREVKRFLRVQNKQPWFAAGDDLPETPAGTSTPEEEVSRRDLAEHVFSMLPPEERRVVILVEIDRLTFREVAEREGISPSTAYERHQRGMAALRDAAERSEQNGLHAFPLFPAAVAARFGAGGSAGPPPDLADRAWDRAVVELGLDRPDPRPVLRPFVQAPKLAVVAAVGLGGVLGGTMLGRCAVDAGAPILRPEATHGAFEAPPAARAAQGSDPEPSIPSQAPAAELPASAPPTQRGQDPGVLRIRGEPYTDRLASERALVQRGRRALSVGDVPAALEAFAEHAQRFPAGQSVAERDELWSLACARLDPCDPRCACRP